MRSKKEKKNNKPKFNIFLYRIVQIAAWLVAIFKLKRKILRNEIKNKKGPFVIIANHESSIDFVNLICATKTPMSFVISNSFYSTLPFKSIISRLGMIPKQQFQTSLRDLAAMKGTLKSDGVLTIYPAGLMCEDGNSTPIPDTTYEFLKWLNADIYVAKTIGTYFALPKWAVNSSMRRGRTYLDIYKLFDKDEIHDMELSEIKQRTTDALDFDAYLEQEKLRIKYEEGDNIDGLENVLYLCPNCRREFTMRVKNKNTILCRYCGYKEKSDKYAFLHIQKCAGTEMRYVSAWSKMIYADLKQKIKSGEESELSTLAIVQLINPKKRKYVTAGVAKITLNRENMSIDGIINGEDVTLSIKTVSHPSLPFKPGKYFEIQHGDRSYRCFPKNGAIVMKWINMVKIFYELSLEEKAENEAAEAELKQSAEAASEASAQQSGIEVHTVGDREEITLAETDGSNGTDNATAKDEADAENAHSQLDDEDNNAAELMTV